MISALKLRNFDEDGRAASRDPDLPTREEMEEAVAKARKQGHIEGYLTGADDGRAEMRRTMEAKQAEMVDAFTHQLAGLAAQAEAAHEALVAQVVGFTLQTCEVLFPEMIERMSTDRVRRMTTQSLKMAIASHRIQVRLSPATLEAIGPELRARAAYYKCDAALDLQADPALPDGETRMEWDHGSLDYGFARICERLLAELRSTHERALAAQKERTRHGQA
jgi:flagellar biosynthesis/type III secretory pathway protein FliH